MREVITIDEVLSALYTVGDNGTAEDLACEILDVSDDRLVELMSEAGLN